MTDFEELSARYDARNSFYGKAHVSTSNGTRYLMSYETIVAAIPAPCRLVLYPEWDCSLTTMRHVVEFVKHAGYWGQMVNVAYIRRLIRQDPDVVESEDECPLNVAIAVKED